MATMDSVPVSQPQTYDRPGRRRPFSTWMKKLANFKGSSSADAAPPSTSKRNAYPLKSQSKKNGSRGNNPYMSSVAGHGSSTAPVNENMSFSTNPTGRTISTSSLERSRRSCRSSVDEDNPPVTGNCSVAQAEAREHDHAHSDIAQSHGASSGAGTAVTTNGGNSTTRGVDSTFSSPAPSIQSLTTTLTTIHSTNAGPGNAGSATTNAQGGSPGTQANNPHSIQFTHQFPTSPPATAIPAHLAPQQGSGGHPATYSTITANNLLTDNASILTLASSSKRRRRRSMDTDASVRALAPSSLFGGSRESLPLSVLSYNIEAHNVAATGIHQSRPSVGGPAERASIYSAAGVAPALTSERNSFYAGKQNIMGDGGSVKSGLVGHGHGRTDSINGSIAGIASASSPLASPREVAAPATGRASRRNSAQEHKSEKA